MPNLRSQSKVGENVDLDESNMDERTVESMGDPEGAQANITPGVMPTQLFERVVVGLHETQIGMTDLRKCMNEAYVGMTATCVGMNEARDGMNEAREGMHELREMIACQGENINRLLDAMTNLLSNSNAGKISESQSSRLTFNKDDANDTSRITPVGKAPSQIKVKIDKDAIPYFDVKENKDNLSRSKDLETWLRRIELVTPDDADEARIRLARTYCKGTADLVINSPEFETIEDWARFKSLLRRKFKGTANSSDFFCNLQRKTMRPGQTPQDFLLEIEGIVYMGLREYSIEIGDPVALIRRIFMSGLPADIADILIACEELPLYEIVTKANKLFSSRTPRAPQRNPREPLPIAATHAPEPVATPVAPYCFYHRSRGHSTAECREKPQGNVCWHCRRPDHRRYACPFHEGWEGQASGPLGKFSKEARSSRLQ